MKHNTSYIGNMANAGPSHVYAPTHRLMITMGQSFVVQQLIGTHNSHQTSGSAAPPDLTLLDHNGSFSSRYNVNDAMGLDQDASVVVDVLTRPL